MTIATVFLIAFLLVVVAGTLAAVRRDGYRKLPTTDVERRIDDSIWR